MGLRSIRTIIRVVFLTAVVALGPRPTAADAPTLPESPPAQQMIYKVEEIFHTHPERIAECERLLQEVLASYPGTCQASLALAYLSYGNRVALKDTVEAEQLHARLGKEFPDSLALGELFILEAEADEEAGQYETAKDAYANAIDVLQHHVHERDGRLMRYTAARLLASLYEVHLDKPAAAVAVLLDADRALAGTPQQEGVWMNLAGIAGRHGGEPGVPRLDELSDDKLTDLAPQSRATAILGAVNELQVKGDYVKAAEALALLEAAYPGSAPKSSILLQKAALLERLQPDDAHARADLWQQVVDQFPADPRAAQAYSRLAWHFLENGDTDRAIAEAKSGGTNPSLYPSSRGGLWRELGDMHQGLGRREDAIAAYQEARAAGAGTPPAWTAVRRLEELGVDPWPRE